MNYIFPTPIEIITPSNVQEIQNEININFWRVKYVNFQDPDHGNVDISNGTLEENIIESLSLKNLKHCIETTVNNYCKELEIITEVPLKITKSWILKTKTMGYGALHSHKCLVSGVYYFRTDSQSGNLRFHNVIGDDLYKMFNGRYTEYTPEIGKLVIFPGWLPHEILTNYSNEERISIGFHTDV